jgi:hypothetical protein
MHRVRLLSTARLLAMVLAAQALTHAAPAADEEPTRALSLAWDKEMLSIRGKHLPGGEVSVWYIEAFCRPGSTRRDSTQDDADRDEPRQAAHHASV